MKTCSAGTERGRESVREGGREGETERCWLPGDHRLGRGHRE